MAEAGADVLVPHMGLTTGGTIGAQTGLTLDEAVERVQALRDAAREVNPDILCLCHGGPIAEPDDAAARPRQHDRHRRLLRRVQHRAAADRGRHDGEHAAVQVHPDREASMSGRFITRRGHRARPGATGASRAGSAARRSPGRRRCASWTCTSHPAAATRSTATRTRRRSSGSARGASSSGSRRTSTSSGPARRSTSRRTSSTRRSRSANETAKLSVILTPDRGRRRLLGRRRLRRGALGVAEVTLLGGHGAPSTPAASISTNQSWCSTADLAGELGVAGGDRVDDRLVRIGEHAQVGRQRDHRERGVVGDAEAAPHRVQQLVLARHDDDAGGSARCARRRRGCRCARRRPHRVDLGLQRRHVVAESRRREPGGELLERRRAPGRARASRGATGRARTCRDASRCGRSRASRARAAPRGPAPGSSRRPWRSASRSAGRRAGTPRRGSTGRSRP